MPTSGITDWPLTAEEIVTQAMYELGELSEGEAPTGEEMEDGLVRLNSMLKTWAGEGNLFREEIATVTVVGGTGSVALAAGVRDVASVRYVVSATNHRQLAEWNRGEFYRLPNRSAAGNPTAYYLAKSTAGLTLSVWPVPSTDITLELDQQRSAQTVTDPSEAVDVPQEWQEALVMGLASRLASMLGTTENAPAKVVRIDQRSQALYQHLLDRDRPDSYIFEPDY
jgi:hypothetical protein